MMKELIKKYINLSTNSIILSKNPEMIKFKLWIYQNTKFLDKLNPSLKMRILCIHNNIEEIPKCNNCNNHTSINKADSKEFNLYCSTSCRQKSKIFIERDWLFEQRIALKKSKEIIAKELGCSIVPVNKWLKIHNIPDIKYNETSPIIKTFLKDKNWMVTEYVNNKKTCDEIGEMLGISSSTISIWLNIHNIEARDANEYPRKFNRTSSLETLIYEWLLKNYTGKIILNDRVLLKGKEIDILLPDDKLAIEINGLLWHSEEYGKNKDYHLDKTIATQKAGYTLIHLYEDQIKNKFDICVSIINSKLNNNKRIYARKCIVGDVDSSTARVFLDDNHIQGFSASTIKKGLYYNNRLVALMTFGKARYSKHKWELIRFCSILNTTIVGGFSRLLKHSGLTNIVSYADRMYSEGDVYEKNGFTLIATNKPNYYYMKNGVRYNRMSFQKKSLFKKLKTYNPDITEEENMSINGYRKIWNCGTLTYEIN